NRVAHDTDAEGVRDPDRRRQQARLAHPLQPGQLAVAVQAVTPGKERGLRWDDHGHAGAHVLAFDQRGVADEHAVDVADRVASARVALTDRDAEVPRTHARTLLGFRR